MAEAFLAGLIGFLIGKGIPPRDAESVVEALRTYLGFEPPLGLTGYALEDIAAGEEKKASVVVRGKAYDVVALEAVAKHSAISILGKKDALLQVAPTIESLKKIDLVDLIAQIATVTTIQTIQNIENIQTIQAINRIKYVDTGGLTLEHIKNGNFRTGDFTGWKTQGPVTLVTDPVHGYAAKILSYDAAFAMYFPYQRVEPFIGENVAISATCKADHADGTMYLSVVYMDGSSEHLEFTPTLTWTARVFEPTFVDKRLQYFLAWRQRSPPADYCYLTNAFMLRRRDE